MPYKDEIERRKAKRRRYRLRRDEILAYESARRAKNPDAFSTTRLLRRYGITLADRQQMLEDQGGLCALCRLRPPSDIDHDHDADVIRGLLCRACNVGLGLLGDSVERLLAAIAYLQRPVPQQQRRGEKKTRPRGQDCHNSKLTEDIVRTMRAEHAEGAVSFRELAAKYDLHPEYAEQVIRRKAWAHVP